MKEALGSYKEALRLRRWDPRIRKAYQQLKEQLPTK